VNHVLEKSVEKVSHVARQNLYMADEIDPRQPKKWRVVLQGPWRDISMPPTMLRHVAG